MTRSDPDYPSRLKKHLKADAPPVLFGCGNRQLLDRGGIAIVGSRDTTPEQLAATVRLAGETADQGFSVVSGGARGVDEAAMLGALEKEGTVIGILADNLLRSATSAKYRTGIVSKNLVLVSPYNPEAGFEVGNAMARNKYTYCLSDAAIVVTASIGIGFSPSKNEVMENVPEPFSLPTFYGIFLQRLETATAVKAATLEQLLDTFELCKTQLTEWLKKGVSDGRIKKLNNPVRYRSITATQQSLNI